MIRAQVSHCSSFVMYTVLWQMSQSPTSSLGVVKSVSGRVRAASMYGSKTVPLNSWPSVAFFFIIFAGFTCFHPTEKEGEKVDVASAPTLLLFEEPERRSLSL